MNYQQWHAEADRLKKCLDYEPYEASRVRYRVALARHLESIPEPEESTTPLPQIDPGYTPTVELDGEWVFKQAMPLGPWDFGRRDAAQYQFKKD